MRKAAASLTLQEIEARAKSYQFQTTCSTSSTPAASKCPYGLCDGGGTINTFRWVEDPGYHYNGEPVKHQVATVIPCKCHTETVFEKYNASAGMKPDERLETFDAAEFDDDNRAALTQCRRFVESIDAHLQKGSWLYIYGDEDRAKKAGKGAYGTGKSYVTHCIGNHLTSIRQKAIYITEDKLFEEIKDTYNRSSNETESQVLWKYEHVPILLIDDLFKSKTTDWTEDKLFHLLDKRKGPGKVTIINSNYAPNRIELILPKNGPAIASRIIGEAVLIEMIGRDRRRDKALRRRKEAEA
jgi:DNA replication protein DnaC